MSETSAPPRTSPLLERQGAVAADGPDAGVAAHYGDPMREQRRLAHAEAVVDLSHRGVVTITGADRRSWLHSLTSAHLTDLAPYTSTESLILSPKGRVEHDLHVVDDGETLWMTVEPGTAPDVAGWLDSMRFMLRVEVADVSDAYAVVGEVSDQEWAAGDASAAIAWVDRWPNITPGGVSYSGDGEHPAVGRRWREVIVPRESLVTYVGDRSLSGVWAAEAERIAAWRPRLGVDTDHKTIAHELDWLRTAVHLQKGCYRGQETIARVHNLGRPPRRVVFLHLDGSGHALPAPGSSVEVSGNPRAVGQLTSVARHFEDGPIGLAVIKRSVPTDIDLLVDGIAAAQTVIVES